MTLACLQSVTFDAGLRLRLQPYPHEVERILSELSQTSTLSFVGRPAVHGNWHLSLLEAALQLVFLGSEEGPSLRIPLAPLRRIFKDYRMICEHYQTAVQAGLDPHRMEAIDMGRRGVHNEGAQLLQELLEKQAIMDFATARLLFSLFHFCVR